MELDMRVLRADLEADLHDVRGMRPELEAVYDESDYTASQALARTLRARRSWGIAYDSVRHAGGECAAVFRPPALSHCTRAEHFAYVWDGVQIGRVYRKTMPK